ncbi:hypothetical protein LTR37_021024 [Vermiconidia calcicola]|uniref:Uncharacterized protein n=1 Tax=Vermiconidia calcicola TaxID=1690605 RepID=A0ACC3MBL0_9PEZI|nr:hypothetical protein LTR37_021024 [Vermiconidia calcicola]
MANRVPQPQGDQCLQAYNRKFSRFSLQNNVHCVPVDQNEQQRLEELDGILREFHGRTVFPPFPPPGGDDEPVVLDCGCGQGAWIDNFMDEFGPDVDVTGVDIFFGRGDDEEEDPDQSDSDGNGVEAVEEYRKKRWNLNARFRDAPAEDRLRRESFDLINSRFLTEGINTDRWSSYIRELKELLKPGGWLQMAEVQLHFQSSNGRLRDDSNLARWWQWYSYTLPLMGKNPRVGRELGRLLGSAGLRNVRSHSFDLPIGGWNPGMPSL